MNVKIVEESISLKVEGDGPAWYEKLRLEAEKAQNALSNAHAYSDQTIQYALTAYSASSDAESSAASASTDADRAEAAAVDLETYETNANAYTDSELQSHDADTVAHGGQIHTHANRAAIDKVGESGGDPTWDGAPWPQPEVPDIPPHNDLSGIQGGVTADYQHITTAEKDQIHSHANRAAIDLIGNDGGSPTWDGGPWPQASIPPHNDLSGLQGGAVDDYQHVTTAEKGKIHAHANRTALDLIGDDAGDPTWNGAPWPQADIPPHNDLTGIQGGATDDHQHVTTTEKGKIHEHANRAALDKLGDDAGSPTWDGAEWPGSVSELSDVGDVAPQRTAGKALVVSPDGSEYVHFDPVKAVDGDLLTVRIKTGDTFSSDNTDYVPVSDSGYADFYNTTDAALSVFGDVDYQGVTYPVEDLLLSELLVSAGDEITVTAPSDMAGTYRITFADGTEGRLYMHVEVLNGTPVDGADTKIQNFEFTIHYHDGGERIDLNHLGTIKIHPAKEDREGYLPLDGSIYLKEDYPEITFLYPEWAPVSTVPGLPGQGEYMEAVSHDANFIYIGGNNGLRVIDKTDWSVVSGTPTIAGDVKSIANDAGYVYVAHQDSPYLTVIDKTDWSLVSGLPTMPSSGAVVDVDSDYLYWLGGNDIKIIDKADWSLVTGSPSLPSGVSVYCAIADGSYLYVGSIDSPFFWCTKKRIRGIKSPGRQRSAVL